MNRRPNYAAVILAPPLLLAVTAAAPGIRLDLRPSGLRDMQALLDRGELDLAIGSFDDVGQRFAAARLLEDSFVMAMRHDHPVLARELTPQPVAALPYLEIFIGMLWHRRFDNQPAHLWLRKLVQQTAASR
jgi:DNA-binding transcriptional LysR family regulator